MFEFNIYFKTFCKNLFREHVASCFVGQTFLSFLLLSVTKLSSHLNQHEFGGSHDHEMNPDLLIFILTASDEYKYSDLY